MSRTWPYFAAVAVVGVVAGVAIGGSPQSSDPFVIAPDQIPTTTLFSTASTSILVPQSTTPTGSATTTTLGATDATTDGTTGGSDGSGTTIASDGAPRVLLIDASGVATALSAATAALTGAGYTAVDGATANTIVAATTIYYREGFAEAAAQVAVDLGLSGAEQKPLTDQVLSDDDSQGDILVQLGPDVSP